MGDQHVARVQGDEGARHFTHHLLQDVRALEYMLQEGRIEDGVRRIGAEQELFLVDRAWQPAPVADRCLARATDPRITSELALFNLELNLAPLVFEGGCLGHLEAALTALLADVRDLAAEEGAEILMTGILPTIRMTDLTLANMTPRERYHALNERMTRMRGRAYEFHIRGIDELTIQHDSVMLEGCNTSFQVHLQVGADEFARIYNIAQAVTAPVLAAAVNAPLLFGKRLWKETRIALFQQSIDTRSGGSYLREVSPRVTFGTQWVRDSVLDVFKEDIARFCTIVSAERLEDPFEVLARGEVPRLGALQVHNSTVYRWNRACYGVTQGKPHLRIENRVLPSGPTPADEVANSAFWLGLMCGMAHRGLDVTQRLDFDDAKSNFLAAARMGLEAQMRWFDREVVPTHVLIVDELLPLAFEGLERHGIDPDDAERYLGIIRERVRRRRTGARWQLDAFDRLKDWGSSVRRLSALTAAMACRQRTGAPVHTWDLPSVDEAEACRTDCLRVEQCMSTDLFTVREDDALDLAAAVMDWRRIRHLPVEDDRQQLVGLITLRTLLHLFVDIPDRATRRTVAVRDVMIRDPITVRPETPLREALACMRTRQIGSLPVVRNGRLVGIITERDFMEMAARALERRLPETADPERAPARLVAT